MNAPTLPPCPFCGDPMERVTGEHPNIVRHTHPRVVTCVIGGRLYADTSWNRRVPVLPPAAPSPGLYDVAEVYGLHRRWTRERFDLCYAEAVERYARGGDITDHLFTVLTERYVETPTSPPLSARPECVEAVKKWGREICFCNITDAEAREFLGALWAAERAAGGKDG